MSNESSVKNSFSKRDRNHTFFNLSRACFSFFLHFTDDLVIVLDVILRLMSSSSRLTLFPMFQYFCDLTHDKCFVILFSLVCVVFVVVVGQGQD